MKDIQARIRITYGYYIQGDLSTITKIAELMSHADIVSPRYIHSGADPVMVAENNEGIEMQINVKPALCTHAYESLVAAHEHNAQGKNDNDEY